MSEYEEEMLLKEPSKMWITFKKVKGEVILLLRKKSLCKRFDNFKDVC